MEKRPTIVAKRLCELREGIHISQSRLAAIFDLDQPAVFRYENAQSFPPYGVLMQYANFFNVSLDYIFGRTDNPQGAAYDYQIRTLSDDNLSAFVEMCFDPKSPENAKLKKAVLQIIQEHRNIELKKQNGERE